MHDSIRGKTLNIPGAINWIQIGNRGETGRVNTIAILSKDQIENLKTRQLLNPMFHWIGMCEVTTEHLTIGHNLVGQPIKQVQVIGFGKCLLKVNMTKHDFANPTVMKEIQLIKMKE